MATGLDRASAPPFNTCVAMANAIGASWWCAYIGGPTALGSGWSPDLCRQLIGRGIGVLPVYAGRQEGGPLTFGQGQVDGADACDVMATTYGWKRNVVLCLDVEHKTFESDPAGCGAYMGSWVSAVHGRGYIPMVYGNPGTLIALSERPADQLPNQVWIASWTRHAVDASRDPARVTSFPDDLWANNQRAWQYAGEFDGQACRVLGLDVDISCSNCRVVDILPGEEGHEPGARSIAELEALNPSIRQQLAQWQRERVQHDEDPNVWPDFRQHAIDLHAPDPGPVAFAEFRCLTIAELAVANPNIRGHLQQWQEERRQNGEDPRSWPDFRQHEIELHAPDPGPRPFVGF
jgi:Rv2525c-like, glycoside hydrolase-like domain